MRIKGVLFSTLTIKIAIKGITTLVMKDPKYEVIGLAELVRHGARTPNRDYFKDKIFEELGYGKLTGNGQRQQFLLGYQLQVEYPEIFHKEFQSSDYLIYSSKKDRTIMSAYSQLMGLTYRHQNNDENLTGLGNYDEIYFPPFFTWDKKNFTNSNKPFPFDINIIPVQTLQNEDFTFMRDASKKCPKLKKFIKKNRDNFFEKNLDIINKGGMSEFPFYFKEDLLKNYGLSKNIIGNLKGITSLWSDLLAYYFYYGEYYKSEKKMDDVFFNKLKNLASFLFHYKNWGDNPEHNISGKNRVTRLYTSEISKKILNFFKEKMENGDKGNPAKFMMFSGHDSNTYPFMYNLNLTSSDCHKENLIRGIVNNNTDTNCKDLTKYTSNLLFELSTFKGKFYVRLLYGMHPIKFCDGEFIGNNQNNFYCEFEVFEKKVREVLILGDKEREELCFDLQGFNWFYFILIFALFSLSVLLCFLIREEIKKGKVKNNELENLELLGGSELN